MKTQHSQKLKKTKNKKTNTACSIYISILLRTAQSLLDTRKQGSIKVGWIQGKPGQKLTLRADLKFWLQMKHLSRGSWHGTDSLMSNTVRDPHMFHPWYLHFRPNAHSSSADSSWAGPAIPSDSTNNSRIRKQEGRKYHFLFGSDLASEEHLARL